MQPLRHPLCVGQGAESEDESISNDHGVMVIHHCSDPPFGLELLCAQNVKSIPQSSTDLHQGPTVCQASHSGSNLLTISVWGRLDVLTLAGVVGN